MARIAVRNVISQMVECLYVRSVLCAAEQGTATTDLRVLYAQDSWRQRERDQRGRKQHLEAGNIAFTRLGLLVEWVGGVHAVAVRGTWSACQLIATRGLAVLHTDAKMAVVLVECHEVHRSHLALW